MNLIKFRVKNFRSIKDSGWIETNNVTSLIGTNESGKTNLLIALWKINPAKDGAIDPISDYPRKHFHDLRAVIDKPVFIDTEFELQGELINEISEKTNYSIEELKIVKVSRKFDGEYVIKFPNAIKNRPLGNEIVINLINHFCYEIEEISPLKSEIKLKDSVLQLCKEFVSKIELSEITEVLKTDLEMFLENFENSLPSKTATTSTLIPKIKSFLIVLKEHLISIPSLLPEEISEIKDLIISNLPVFVYYSNYGNLDSEIYLPHVIENLNRQGLGVHQEAKTRTLKILFEFVKLQPQEILDLGRDIADQPGSPTDEEIKKSAEKKKERDILLQSAATQLTDNFRGWWRQGNYRFRFQADGNHFRIWVSDDKRTEDIELEARSSGLQWFFSFYLVFLVESTGTHKNAILLLDEPGVTLHPLAQRDLSDFFENLSKTNQLLYTAHSPFMVNPDQLDRVKAVYISQDGTTLVTSDLKVVGGHNQQTNSIYPVYAALGLSVSDTLLEGCQSVIVEGPSDQYYLSAIKNYLIGKSMISPSREILFLPSGGVSGIKAVVPIISGKNSILPYVILDSDSIGKKTADSLKLNLYKSAEGRVISIGEFVGYDNSEIEDIFPADFLAKVITNYLKGPEEDFSDCVKEDQPIIPQVESYVQNHGLNLDKGWKVEIARIVKSKLLSNPDIINVDSSNVNEWKNLFNILLL